MAARKKRKSLRLTPAEQSARFIEAAKEAGANEHPRTMDEAMRRIAESKKPPQKR